MCIIFLQLQHYIYLLSFVHTVRDTDRQMISCFMSISGNALTMLVLVILTENRVLDVNTHDRYQPITERERENQPG